MISNREVVRIAADEVGVAPPARSARLMRAEADVDCAKATRELGWQPRPVQESIRDAVRFWAEMRLARRKTQCSSARIVVNEPAALRSRVVQTSTPQSKGQM